MGTRSITIKQPLFLTLLTTFFGAKRLNFVWPFHYWERQASARYLFRFCHRISLESPPMASIGKLLAHLLLLHHPLRRAHGRRGCTCHAAGDHSGDGNLEVDDVAVAHGGGGDWSAVWRGRLRPSPTSGGFEMGSTPRCCALLFVVIAAIAFSRRMISKATW